MSDAANNSREQQAHAAQASIARCIGEAIGIMWKAVRTPVNPAVVEVHRHSETLQHNGVTLRRTTIDEVVLKTPHNS